MSTPKEIDGIPVILVEEPWDTEFDYPEGSLRAQVFGPDGDLVANVEHNLALEERADARALLIANAPRWQAKAIEQQARIKALEAENERLHDLLAGVSDVLAILDLDHFTEGQARKMRAVIDYVAARQHGAEATRDA